MVTDGRVATGPVEDATELQAGDSIHFPGSVEHCYEGRDAENRALLMVIHPDVAGG